MAVSVRAIDSVTVLDYTDVSNVKTWYKTVSRTSSAPTVSPTATESQMTSNGWSTTEPGVDTTKKLYTVHQCLFGDGTYVWGDVSLSSAYEAAIEAYNAASSAHTTATTALEQSVEYIVGTQTSATNAWTGVTTDSTLKTGKTIAYKLPKAGNSSAATLNLTLAGGGTTGAKGIKWNSGSNVTTHYGAGAVINMTYDGTNWMITEYNSDTVDNRLVYLGNKTGSKGIWATSLFMEDGAGTYQNICTASDGTVTSSNRTTATTKKANTNGFKVGGGIFYSSTTYAAATNIDGWGSVYSSMGNLFDSRYSLNTTLTAGSLTAYKPWYLVGSINASDGLFYLDSTWWTQTPNVTGKVYILGGGVYDSTTSNCRITLYEHNTWFVYDGTNLVPFDKYMEDEAAKVATNYVSDFSNGVLVHPENDTDNGVKITDKVEIMRLVDNSSLPVAEFGESARIGLPNDANKVEIQSDKISMTAYTGAKALEVVIPADGATSENLVGRLSYGLLYDYNNYASEEITVNSTSYVQSATKTITDSVLTTTIANDVAIDDTFEIGFQVNQSPVMTLEDYLIGSVDGTAAISFEFTKKASGTYTKTVDNHLYWNKGGDMTKAYRIDYSIQCTYNAATNEFSFYIKAKKNTSESKQFSISCIIYRILFTKITLNSRTYINGDVFLNSYEQDGEPQPTFTDTFIYGGNLYMYIDEEGADSDLYDAIVALGWDADVLPPISFESV